MPAAEILDRVNEQNQSIGRIAREDVFRAQANFRVVHVFIFNDDSQLLLQKLASTRARHPGRWGSSLAAYVAAGEEYVQAARRRLWEELGIVDVELEHIGETEMLDETCRKFIALYACRHGGPFAIDASHIAAVEFVALEQVRKLAILNPSSFTPTFLTLLDFYTRNHPS